MWWSKTSGQFISKEKENIYEILELSASHIVRRWSSSIFNCRFNIFLIKLLWINSAILEEKVNYFLFLWIFYTELSICSFEIPKFFSICEYIQEVLYKLRKLKVVPETYYQWKITHQMIFPLLHLSVYFH